MGDSTEPDEGILRGENRQAGKRCLGVLDILREDHHSSDPSPEAK